jgi:ferric-dicitrate binding protein FerR (iron transport regulator)
MDLNRKDENREDEICTKVLCLLQAMQHPDILNQMEKSKETVYNRVNRKMDADMLIDRSKRYGRNIRILSLTAACIALLCIVTAYQAGLRSAKKTPGQTQVEWSVPYGIVSKVTLSDGTLVTLNGGSKLTYPGSFDGEERRVSLSGEGFFEVAKDEKHPFTVNAKNLSVKVLGTRFAFKAYEEDLHSVLTLEEGSIEAIPVNEGVMKKEGVLLKPAQQLILDNQTGELKRKNVNTDEYTSWKEGILHFRDLTLNEIAVILERRFDMKIRILSEEIGDEHYVAQFKYGENAEQILDKLSYKRSWKYIKQPGVIEIKKK